MSNATTSNSATRASSRLAVARGGISAREALRDQSTNLVRADDRPSQIVAFEESMVGYFVDAADVLGIPKSVAAIYGICFASPGPLSFSEIAERLELSAGSISQGVRVLKEVGALKVVHDEGDTQPLPQDSSSPAAAVAPEVRSRGASHSLRRGRPAARERYAPDMELRKLIARYLDQRLQQQLSSGRDRLRRILESVPPDEGGSTDALKTRINGLQAWQDQALAVLPLVKAFLKLP